MRGGLGLHTGLSRSCQDGRQVKQFSQRSVRGDRLSELDWVEVADEFGEAGLVVDDEDDGIGFVEADEFEICCC